MSLISLAFFACLFAAATAFYVVPPRWRTGYLLALSYAFYATWSIAYLGLLVATTAVVFAAGHRIAQAADEHSKRIYLGAAVGAMVALVAAFKLAGQINGVIFPLGLSYYSFKLISYLVEVYWDETTLERSAAAFFLYPAFFPQIVSGPIQRPGDFFAQLRQGFMSAVDYGRIECGFRLILGGLMLKLLIADRLGLFIGIVDQAPGEYRRSILLTSVCCYTLQLYADFAGYSNIAIGVGRIFGIESPPNFAAPLAASNIPEMWRRWHMTLTSWIADYVFMPLQLALRDLGRGGLAISVTVSMVAIGLWHGMTLNFLIFGLCHAIFIIATALTAGWRRRRNERNAWLAWPCYVGGVSLTFVLMTFSQIFFHARTWGDAVTSLGLLTGWIPHGHRGWGDIRVDAGDPVYVCMAVAFFVAAGAPGFRMLIERVGWVVPNWMQYGVALFLLSALSLEAGSGFIYGQF